jgi:hypothetical protein
MKQTKDESFVLQSLYRWFLTIIYLKMRCKKKKQYHHSEGVARACKRVEECTRMAEGGEGCIADTRIHCTQTIVDKFAF